MNRWLVSASAAAVAAASMAATTSVQSSNVVGYVNTEVGEYYSLQVACFDMIGYNTYDIQDFKPSAGEGVPLGGGTFDLQTLDDAGGMAEQFIYMTAEDDGAPQDGWYEDDMETFAIRSFSRGEGFMYNNSCGEASVLTFSGQVNTNAVTVVAPEYYSLMGNIRPYPISIQDMIPTASEGTPLGGGTFDLQTFDDAGGMAEQFIYMTEEDDGAPQDGWYEEDMETFATKTFAINEGFMFNNSCGEEAGLAYK